MSGYSKTQEKIIEWAEDRNLIKGSNPLAQMRKLREELEELNVELTLTYPTFKPPKKIKDEFGDLLVVATIMAKQMDITFEECLEIAYEKIKDRKGRMINGVFVKEKDLPENA